MKHARELQLDINGQAMPSRLRASIDEAPGSARNHRYTVLIADTNEASRKRLCDVVGMHTDLGRIHQSADPDEAFALIGKEKPDLVFVDANIAGVDPRAAQMPPAIIIADSDWFAVRAFELRALDYLVRPIDSLRLARSLNYGVEQIRRGDDRVIAESVVALLEELREREKRPARFLVFHKGKYCFVAADSIDWIEAADNYVVLHAGTRQYLVRETMSNMESRLEPGRFIRIRRSAIVNVDRVATVEPYSGTEYRIVLFDGTMLVSGRRFKENLRTMILRG